MNEKQSQFNAWIDEIAEIADAQGIGVLKIYVAWQREQARDQRIAQLEAALKPFAVATHDMRGGDESIIWDSLNYHITQGDCRKALKALEAQP